MSNTNWTIETAIAVVTRTGGTITKKAIRHNRAGIHVLGAIDFLCGKGFHKV